MNNKTVKARLLSIEDRFAQSPHDQNGRKSKMIVLRTGIANPFTKEQLNSDTLDALCNEKIAESIAEQAGFIGGLSSLRDAVGLGLTIEFEPVLSKKGEPVLDSKGNPAIDRRTNQPYGVYEKDTVRFTNIRVSKGQDLSLKMLEMKESAAIRAKMEVRMRSLGDPFSGETGAYGNVQRHDTSSANAVGELEGILGEEENEAGK